MQRKVFISRNMDHSYERAKEFGELVYITEGKVDIFAVGELYDLIKESMKDASEDDLILISGLSLSNSIASSIMAYKFGVVNFLLYRKGEYLMKRVIFGLSKQERGE